MNNQHNPIAQLITQIQDEYIHKVCPYESIKLVRWLIKPDQARLYEGFLKLESTPQGSLPEVPIVLLAPFEEKDVHSARLIKDWIEGFKKDKTLSKETQASNLHFDWDVAHYERKFKAIGANADNLLLEMLETFQAALPNKEMQVVLCLFPYSVAHTGNYSKWIDNLLTLGLCKKARLMCFDYTEERHFDQIMIAYQPDSISLSVPLDLEGAINKLATMGNPNDPEIKFRKCMMEMFKGVGKKNLPHVLTWGEKGLQVTQKSGSNNAYATAHVIYAGMLFNFKQYEQVEDLLLKGLAIGKRGLAGGDATCKPIIIQAYGYQASCKQLQKKKEAATALFCKQADTAIAYDMPVIALSAWWLAYNAIKKKDKAQYKSLIKKAYIHGTTITPKMLKASCMHFIAADYYNLADADNDRSTCDAINTFMTEVEDENWRASAEAHRKKTQKKSLAILNWF